MWHFGQIADTMSTSRDSSVAQPVVPAGAGSGLVAPFWLTFVRQPAPVEVSQAGSPHADRYTARSDTAVGSSYASTTATDSPAPAVDEGRL